VLATILVAAMDSFFAVVNVVPASRAATAIRASVTLVLAFVLVSVLATQLAAVLSLSLPASFTVVLVDLLATMLLPHQ
jgi:hypothetical protein